MAEWAEFYDLEPWGFEAADMRHGILSTVIARGNGSKTAVPENFMMKRVEAPEEDLEAKLDFIMGLDEEQSTPPANMTGPNGEARIADSRPTAELGGAEEGPRRSVSQNR